MFGLQFSRFGTALSFLPEYDGEDGPFAGRASDTDNSALRLHCLLYERESEPGTGHIPRCLRSRSEEFSENFIEIIGIDTVPAVHHVECDRIGLFRKTDCDHAFRRAVLDGILAKIQDALLGKVPVDHDYGEVHG